MNSSLYWFGSIPNGWRTPKLSYVFDLISSGTTPETGTSGFYGGDIPWVTTSELREAPINATQKTITLEALRQHSALRVYPPKTILIAMYGATIGRLGVLNVAATTNQACCALAEPRGIEPTFAFYVLLAARKHLVELATGGGQPNINQEVVRSLRVPLPTLRTQRAIAHFLDHETAKIDGLIANQTEFLAMLDEHRQVLATEAVTKGIDPAVPMQETGIASLGTVPVAWQVVKLKTALNRMEQGWSPQCENRYAEIEEWGVLKVGCVNGLHFDPSENKALPSGLIPMPKYEIHAGDLLMSRANTIELVGSIAVVDEVRSKLMLCDKLYRLHLNPNRADPRFIAYCLSSPIGRQPLEAAATGASPSMKNISQDAVKLIWVALPPVVEQRKIVEFLDRQNEKLEHTRKAASLMIERLRERRSALITAAVTGQIDVTDPVLSRAAA